MEVSRDLLTKPTLSPSTREAMDCLAVAVANMVTLLNSSAVVLGGPLADVARLREHLSAAIPDLALDQVNVVAGTRSPLDGASHEAHRMARSGFGF